MPSNMCRGSSKWPTVISSPNTIRPKANREGRSDSSVLTHWEPVVLIIQMRGVENQHGKTMLYQAGEAKLKRSLHGERNSADFTVQTVDLRSCKRDSEGSLPDGQTGRPWGTSAMEAFANANASPAAHAFPHLSVRLNMLERAIYSTIAYRDVFDFAPTLVEVHRYLHWIRCELSDVAHAIGHEPLSSRLATDGEFYALRDRAHLLALRSERQSLTERFWPVARRYARYLANLPHVRTVGVTGSLAAGNVKPDCDIDFMVLTDAGAMWRTRALAIASALANQKLGSGRLCPNFFLSMAALSLERRSLYDAHELAQLQPLFGREGYEELREVNSWTDAFLPNARGAPAETHYFSRPPLPGLKAFAEWGSRSVFGRALENF